MEDLYLLQTETTMALYYETIAGIKRNNNAFKTLGKMVGIEKWAINIYLKNWSPGPPS